MAEAADKLYQELEAQGIEVLFDDRVESPGVKFNDADLIGIPFRVTLSPRTLEGNNVEFKRRTDKKAQIMPLAGDHRRTWKGLIRLKNWYRMPVFLILILLGTGLAIGFLSGLLGIGGGIIMTPVQYWIYTSAGMSTDLAIKISFATTLAVVLPTAASGVWQHQRQGGINWKAAIFMGIFTAIGSFVGAIYCRPYSRLCS